MSIQHKHRGKHCGPRSEEQSDLGPHCLSMRLHDKKHTFCDYAL